MSDRSRKAGSTITAAFAGGKVAIANLWYYYTISATPSFSNMIAMKRHLARWMRLLVQRCVFVPAIQWRYPSKHLLSQYLWLYRRWKLSPCLKLTKKSHIDSVASIIWDMDSPVLVKAVEFDECAESIFVLCSSSELTSSSSRPALPGNDRECSNQ